MKVMRDKSSPFPRTTSYTVDPEEGEYTFTVLVGKPTHPKLAGQVLCVADGDGCAHVTAVREHLEVPAKR